MTAAVGFPTLRLIRVAIGGWRLGTTAPFLRVITYYYSLQRDPLTTYYSLQFDLLVLISHYSLPGGLLPGESVEMAKPMRSAAARPRGVESRGAARGAARGMHRGEARGPSGEREECVSEGWEPWRPPE